MCRVSWTNYGCGYTESHAELCQNGNYNAATQDYHCTVGMYRRDEMKKEPCRKARCRICFPIQHHYQQSLATPASEASSSYTSSYNTATGHYQQSSDTPASEAFYPYTPPYNAATEDYQQLLATLASEAFYPYTPSYNADTGQQGYAQGHASEPQGGLSYSEWMVYQDPSSQYGATHQPPVYNQENAPDIDFEMVPCSYYRVATEERRRLAQAQRERYYRNKERKYGEE